MDASGGGYESTGLGMVPPEKQIFTSHNGQGRRTGAASANNPLLVQNGLCINEMHLPEKCYAVYERVRILPDGRIMRRRPSICRYG